LGVAVGTTVGVAVGATVGAVVGAIVGITTIVVGGTGVAVAAMTSGTAVDASGEETSFPPPHPVNANRDTTTRRAIITLIILEKLIIQVRSPWSMSFRFKYILGD